MMTQSEHCEGRPTLLRSEFSMGANSASNPSSEHSAAGGGDRASSLLSYGEWRW